MSNWLVWIGLFELIGVTTEFRVEGKGEEEEEGKGKGKGEEEGKEGKEETEHTEVKGERRPSKDEGEWITDGEW